jgi:hypothetical protein
MKLDISYLLCSIRKVLVTHAAINTKSKQQHKWNVPRYSEWNETGPNSDCPTEYPASNFLVLFSEYRDIISKQATTFSHPVVMFPDFGIIFGRFRKIAKNYY